MALETDRGRLWGDEVGPDPTGLQKGDAVVLGCRYLRVSQTDLAENELMWLRPDQRTIVFFLRSLLPSHPKHRCQWRWLDP